LSRKGRFSRVRKWKKAPGGRGVESGTRREGSRIRTLDEERGVELGPEREWCRIRNQEGVV